MLPTSAIMIALATPLVSLYRVGAFKTSDVPHVVGALRWWAAGLIFYASTMFLLRTFYSLKDTRTPMLVNLLLTVVQVGLYLLLSTGVAGWSGLGVNGIPIADAVFFLLSSTTLALLLRRRIGGFDISGIASTFARMGLAAVVSAAAAWSIAAALRPVLPGFAGSLLQVAVGGSAGLAIAFGIARALGVAEVALATNAIARIAARGRRGGK